MNWFDLLLAGILVFYLASGFSRGLVKQLFSLFGFVIALVFAFVGSRFFSGPLARHLDPLSAISYHEALQFLGVEAAVERAAELMAGVLLFVVLFVVFSILFRLLSGSFKAINKLPVIGLVNRLGGALIGLVIGVALCYLLVSMAQLVPVPLCVEAVNGSQLVLWAGEYLPLVATSLKNWLVEFYLDAVAGGGA